MTKDIQIDNPGGGNCGYYALAIGLINAIQKADENTKINLFNHWVEKGLKNISLSELLAVKLLSLNSYKSLLNKFQISLRNIGFLSSKKDLLDKIEKEKEESATEPSIIEGSMLYWNFMELVRACLLSKMSETIYTQLFGEPHGQLNSLNEIIQYNPLASCNETIKLAKKTAKKLHSSVQSKTTNDFALNHKTENAIVKNALLTDVILNNGVVNPHSVILQGAKVVTKPGCWWATHSELIYVAHELGINFCVNGQWNGAIQANLPTVKLNNLDNWHWTTTIESDIPEDATTEKLPNENIWSNKIKNEDYKAKWKGKSEISQLAKKHARENSIVSNPTSQPKQNVEMLIENTLTYLLNNKGLFAHNNRIAVNEIDTARAAPGESDASFARRLQEAEFRRDESFARRLEEAEFSRADRPK